MEETTNTAVEQEQTSDSFMEGWGDEPAADAADQPEEAAETEEKPEEAPADTTNETAPAAGAETSGQDQQEKPKEDAPKVWTLRHMDEVKQVGEADMVILAQKGMDYDRIREKYDESKPVMELFGAFASAPDKGVNTVVIVYRKGNGERAQVTQMRFAEFFNGATDTRVFLYGDGTNKTIYSGMDLDKSAPSAEYFPDLYEAAIGDENTPITALIRHHSRLLAFKPSSAWSVDYNITTTASGGVTTAFYIIPVNRQVGNETPGQVQLLENNPLTMDGKSIYQWKATTSSGNVTSDDRNVSRLSDRVKSTVSGFNFAETITFNRKGENEYWFLCGGKALILNYASNAWYLYTNMPFKQMLEIDGEAYGFAADGKVLHVSRQYRNDDGEDIDAYAATGSMDFDKDWLLKYSPMIFVAIQPESGARISVTVETNRRSDYPEKLVSAGLSTLAHVNFAHFSFGTNRKPQVHRVKMKVKKATFYKLIYKSCSASATATVLETDVKLRYAGNVK